MTREMAAYFVMGSIGVVSLGCSVVGHNLKPGRARNILLTIASVGPLDVVRAWKLWASAIPLAALCLLLPGCPDTAQVAVQQSQIATYASQQQQCVALAGTRAQAEDCIAQVRWNWCGPGAPLQEAGACSYDAGPPVDPELTLTDAGPKDGGGQ